MRITRGDRNFAFDKSLTVLGLRTKMQEKNIKRGAHALWDWRRSGQLSRES